MALRKPRTERFRTAGHILREAWLLSMVLRPVAALGQVAGTNPQTAAARAAATITADAIARDLTVLTADSLRPRATPSRALESAAQYIATTFQRLGLQPGVGDPRGKEKKAPSWIQQYPIPGQRLMDTANSRLHLLLRFQRQGKMVVDGAGESVEKVLTFELGTTAYLTPEAGRQTVPEIFVNIFAAEPFYLGKPLVVVAGRQTIESVRRAADEFRDHTVLYIPAAGGDSAVRRQIIAELYTTSQGVLVGSEGDSAAFATAIRTARQQPVIMTEGYAQDQLTQRRQSWAITGWAGALRSFLAAAGLNPTQLWTDTIPTIRAVPSATGLLIARAITPDQDTIEHLTTAPNVIGLLEGRDPTLKHEYLVISTDLDTRDDGTLDRADRLTKGSETDASGLAGLLAIARAFSQPEARPRRSLLFLAASGGAREGFWGTSYFAGHAGGRRGALTADLHLGPLTRTADSALVIDGLREVELEAQPEWVALNHPELGLVVADGESVVRPEATPYPFVCLAVPSLSFHTGHPADSLSQQTVPTTTAEQTEHIARVARYLFYLGQELANASREPQWSPEGREQLRTVLVP